jgi:hypothetical protein
LAHRKLGFQLSDLASVGGRSDPRLVVLGASPRRKFLVMKKTIALVALAGLLAMGGTALAEIGTIDNVPAATLLLPRFEVEIGSAFSPGNSLTTLFSVNNASDESVIAHVTLWSEWWVPVLDFSIYLTGYDVQTINLSDIINLGDLPNTGPVNSLSNRGEFSGPHNNFGGTCATAAGSAPNYSNITGLFLQIVQQALSGQPLSTNAQCASQPGNTTLARGYVTVDTVRQCNQFFPDNVGYFIDGGAGVATNDNVLWGDYFIVDPGNNFAQGWTLVHIEADAFSLNVDNGACDTTDRNPTTFYCTVRNPTTEPGEDNREGLPSVYATRYAQGGGFDGGTSLIAWRDKNGTGSGTTRSCATTPTPISQTQIVVFDEQENPITQGEGPSGGPVVTDIPFPWCTNRAQVGEDITIASPFGWIYLNLNDGNVDQEYYRQAYVATVMDALGRFSVGYDAIALNNLTLGADNRRGPRNPDPTLGPYEHGNTPTLFNGGFGVLP